MFIKNAIKKLIYKEKHSSNSYINYLKKNGCKVGNNVFFFKPQSVFIDPGRLKYISIGNDVKITEGVYIIAHDFSWDNLRVKYNEFLPTGGKQITIGNNVFIGMNSIILGPCNIGDNVIIGAGSVVKNTIPANSVVAGNPAKVICSFDDYYNKINNNLIDYAYNEYSFLKNDLGREPSISEFGYMCLLFLERNDYNYNNFVAKLPFAGDDKNKVKDDFYNSKPLVNGYDEFIYKMQNYNKKV